MKLSQLSQLLDAGHVLVERLLEADRIIEAFKAQPGDLVACRAFATGAGAPTDSNYGRWHVLSVEVLPIDRKYALSAAVRQRAKVLAELAALDVDLDNATDEDANVGL
jgi:hypothetical protein